MFRKTRFANLVILLSLIPLISICLGRFITMVGERKWNLKALSQPKAVCILVVLALVLSSVLVWTVPQVGRGNGLQFYGGLTFEMTQESVDLSNVIAEINKNPTVDKILVIQPVNEGLPNMYTLQNIEGGTVQYIVHYTVDALYSPMIQEGDYSFLWEILQGLGIKYVVVDGYAIDSYYAMEFGKEMVSTPSYREIRNGLSNSSQFIEVAVKGKITAFQLLDQPSSGQSGLFILGGLEDFRRTYPYLSSQTNNTFLPVTLDSYFSLESLDQLPNWPLLVGPHKTMEDLEASLAILQSQGTILNPASWVIKAWGPSDNWSPGYIQDRIGGRWSPILQEVPNYEWSFSYLPDYGYAYTMGAKDMITYSQSFEPNEYVILARSMYSPEGGRYISTSTIGHTIYRRSGRTRALSSFGPTWAPSI